MIVLGWMLDSLTSLLRERDDGYRFDHSLPVLYVLAVHFWCLEASLAQDEASGAVDADRAS